MPYKPGDFYRICDLTGKKVWASQTRKTWDGLIVWERVYYPKHPQLSIRGIPDRQNVPEPRPRPADINWVYPYSRSDICLISPNGTHYIVHVADDGALLVTAGTWGNPIKKFKLGQYIFTVDNDGALHVGLGKVRPPDPWRLYSPSGIAFDVSVDTDLAVLVTQVAAFPPYMEGVFTLISPNLTSYVVYIVDDMAVLVRPGDWGSRSSNFYLKNYTISVANDGALLAVLSGEKHPVQYRMVSTGGFEYLWFVDPDGAVKIGRQGHWWDVPVLYVEKDWATPVNATGQVTESVVGRWMEE